MSIEVLASSQPKARVAHRCMHCSGQIEPGDHYQRTVCADNGDIWAFKAHIECDQIYNAYANDLAVDEYDLVDWHDVKAWAAEREVKT